MINSKNKWSVNYDETTSKEYLYRYRSFKSFYIDQLNKNQIGGTLFKEFNGVGELKLYLPNDSLDDFNFPRSRIQNMLKEILRSSNNDYYLACLSKNEPSLININWERYGDNGKGFCIEYRTRDIYDACEKAQIDKKYLIISEVKYRSKMLDMTPFFRSYVSEYCKHRTLDKNTNKGISMLISKTIYDENIARMVKDVFLNKDIAYKDEEEVRIVYQNVDPAKSKYENEIVVCKPSCIYVSNKSNIIDKYKIFNYCKINNVAWRVINL